MTPVHRYQAPDRPPVHASQPESRGCAYYAVVVPAGTIYLLYQLGLQLLQKAKEGLFLFGEETADMSQSGLKEGRKIAQILPDAIVEGATPPAEWLSTAGAEAGAAFASAGSESVKLACHAQASALELVQYPLEVSLDVAKEIGDYAVSGGGATVEALKTASNAFAQTVILIGKPLSDGIYELFTYGTSGANVTAKCVVQLPTKLVQIVDVSGSSLFTLMQELISYFPPGAYQAYYLQLMLTATIKELLDRKTLYTLFLEHLSYAYSGISEAEKLDVVCQERIDEVEEVTARALWTVAGEFLSHFDAGVVEADKFVSFAPATMQNAALYFKEVAKPFIQELFSYLFAGGTQAATLFDTVPASLWQGTLFPRELVMGITLETLQYLQSGTVKTKKFLTEAANGIGTVSEVPLEVIASVAKEFSQYLISGAGEAGKGARVLPKAALNTLIVPKECIEAIFIEIGRYLLSGGGEALKAHKLLLEDMPGSFQVLVVNPLQIWWLPKKRDLDAWVVEVQQMISARIAEIRHYWSPASF